MTAAGVSPELVVAITAEVERRQPPGGTPKRRGDEIAFCCPVHNDTHPSASWNRARAVWSCRVCGAGGGARNLAEQLGIEIGRGEGGWSYPPKSGATAATVQPRPTSQGCTLEAYAATKKLDIEFLKSLGVSEITYAGAPAVRMPHFGETKAEERSVMYRVLLEKPQDGDDDRFRLKKGCKALPYGIWRLKDARERGLLLIVEGHSDAQTAWLHDWPALGIPGAKSWKEERDAPLLDGIERIYVLVEPDTGGTAVGEWLSRSSIRNRVHLVTLEGFKDVSEMHVDDREKFDDRLQVALDRATPWSRYEAQRADEGAIGGMGALQGAS